MLAVGSQYTLPDRLKPHLQQSRRAAFGRMVAFARKHRGRLPILVEKTDRLYRNLRDWVAIDELDVFGGIHFRTACNDGQTLGTAVGAYILDRALLPVDGKRVGQMRSPSSITNVRIQ
jgi:hypothetical protein